MTTSRHNRISSNIEVTPDCVIQVDSKSGLVAEAKLSLPRDDAQWESNYKQLEKYDDDLLGWWTSNGRIKKHDIVALVPLPRAVRFADLLEQGSKKRKWRFDRMISVVGFFKASGKGFSNIEKGTRSILEQQARLTTARVRADRLCSSASRIQRSQVRRFRTAPSLSAANYLGQSICTICFGGSDRTL